MRRCAKCKNAYYCSPACQKKHWGAHKHSCGIVPNISVQQNDKVKQASKTHRRACGTSDELGAYLEKVRVLWVAGDIHQAETLLRRVSVSRNKTPSITRLNYHDLLAKISFSRYSLDLNEDSKSELKKTILKHSKIATHILKDEISCNPSIENAELLRTTLENIWIMTGDLKYKKDAKMVFLKYNLGKLAHPAIRQKYIDIEQRITTLWKSPTRTIEDFREVQEILQTTILQGREDPQECRYAVLNSMLYMYYNNQHFTSVNHFVDHLLKMREYGALFKSHKCEKLALRELQHYYEFTNQHVKRVDNYQALVNVLSQESNTRNTPSSV